MSEFGGGRQGPWPTEGRAQAERDHEQDLRDEAERAREIHEAERPKERRRWWWPFVRHHG